MTVRVLCTRKTRIEVASGRYASLDAHHEYYLDDEVAAELIGKNHAVELDADGRPVMRQANPNKPVMAGEQKPTGGAGKPGARRRTKAITPPENKTAEGERTSS